MRRSLPRAFVLLVACSCGVVTGLDDYVVLGPDGGAVSGVDASAPAADGAVLPRDGGTGPAETGAPQDAAPQDGAPDVVVVPGPGCPTNDSLDAPLDSSWLLRGAAALASGGVQLTPDAPAVAGALFWNKPFTFSLLDATIRFRITSSGLAGDGVGVAWLDAASVPAALSSTAGSSLGLGGLNGWAVVIDTFRNPETNDPAGTPFVGLRQVDSPETLRSSNQIPAALDGAEHTLRVVLGSNERVRVSFDGAQVMDAPLNGYTPFTGYFAVVASTGGVHSAHSVTEVTMRAGTTGVCAAQ